MTTDEKLDVVVRYHRKRKDLAFFIAIMEMIAHHQGKEGF